jgi:hypothetical protein
MKTELTKKQEEFLIYVRTLQFKKMNVKEIKEEFIFISMKEIRSRFFNENISSELTTLVDLGLLAIKEKVSVKGHDLKLYSALKPGSINLKLIEYTGAPLDRTTRIMRGYLRFVSIQDDIPTSLYFDTFMKCKEYELTPFYSIDHFSGRVHTPVTSLKGEFRSNILIKGEKTVSLDVATMQPLLLAKILKENIGDNEFSQWINSGQDIYVMLQEKAGLCTRDEGKEKFFNILFGKPNSSLTDLYGNSKWITWINNFKNRPFDKNPKTQEKQHSNMAWLLQTTEVEVMKLVWEALIVRDIVFLSVHDEIIVRESDAQDAELTMRLILEDEFEFVNINRKAKQNELTDTTVEVLVLDVSINKLKPNKMYHYNELIKDFGIPVEQINFLVKQSLLEEKLEDFFQRVG